MKEPRRLSASDPEIARALAMLDRDEPPEGAAGRTFARVRSAASGSVEKWPVDSSSSPRIWVLAGLGLLAGLGVFASLFPGTPNTAPNPAAIVNVSSLSTPAQTGAPASTANEGDVPAHADETARHTVHIEDLPSAAPRATATPSSPPEDPFVVELGLVERARAALSKGRGGDCLDVVKQYEKRFANNGHFKEEVEVMRIEALAMSDARAQARERGARFLENHRETPYAERIRRVLEGSASEP